MKKKNFPRKLGLIITNSITLVRFLGIIPIISAFMSGNVFLAGIITSIVGATDKIDGICARKLNGYSKFGALFDATTDKIFAVILNLLLTTINPLFWLNIIGEVQIGSVNLFYMLNKNIKNNSTNLGKIKTFTLFSEYTLGLLLFNTPLNILIPAMIIGNFALQQKVCKEYINKGLNETKKLEEDKLNKNINNDEEVEKEFVLEKEQNKKLEYLKKLRDDIVEYKNNKENLLTKRKKKI